MLMLSLLLHLFLQGLRSLLSLHGLLLESLLLLLEGGGVTPRG